MLAPLRILYLDPGHAGDRLFLNSLARTLQAVQRASTRMLIVHEGESFEHLRSFNKYLVAQLTDEVVSAVGVQGSDKRLLQVDSNGRVHVHGSAWLEPLVKQGVIPLIACTGRDEAGKIRVLGAELAIPALATALTGLDPIVVAFTQTNKPGATVKGAVVQEISALDLPEDQVADPTFFSKLNGARTVLTNLPALRDDGMPAGTVVKA